VKRIDRDALERCIEVMRNSAEPADRLQIEDMLAKDGWQKAADQAVCHCQMTSLRLRPWQQPPCWIHPRDIGSIIARGDDGVIGDYGAAKLLQKMLRNGLSRFEPDPVAALKLTNPPRAA